MPCGSTGWQDVRADTGDAAVADDDAVGDGGDGGDCCLGGDEEASLGWCNRKCQRRRIWGEKSKSFSFYLEWNPRSRGASVVAVLVSFKLISETSLGLSESPLVKLLGKIWLNGYHFYISSWYFWFTPGLKETFVSSCAVKVGSQLRHKSSTFHEDILRNFRHAALSRTLKDFYEVTFQELH